MSDPKTPAVPPKADVSQFKEMAQAIGQEMLAVVLASQKSASNEAALKNIPPAIKSREICHACRQPLTACKGEHTMMVVYPKKYTEFGSFFPGIILNGERYLSNDEQHQVLVPSACVADFDNRIRAFETNEREIGQSRSKQHHNGDIRRPQQASVTDGWR